MPVSAFRNILAGVPLQQDGTAVDIAPFLAALNDLETRCEARRLSVQVLTPLVRAPFSIAPGIVGPLVAKANAVVQEQAEAALTAASRAAGDDAAAWDCAISDGAIDVVATRFARFARLHDLVVLPATGDALETGRVVAEEALFHGGRPVLIVPEGCRAVPFHKPVLAWDGSARASRALHDALPLLRAAGSVEILCVVESGKQAKEVAGADLAPYLTHHGLSVSVTDLSPEDDDIGATIDRHCRAAGAGLLVMGGFGHSRWREFVLGGVTAQMLTAPPVPALLAY